MSGKKQFNDEFMLNEYNAMKDFRELIVHEVAERVTLYLKMVSTAVTAIPAFSFLVVNSNQSINYVYFCILLIAVTALLWIFGILSFYRVIEGHISIIRYTRAINRARRYFFDKYKAIRPYISMPVIDSVPSFGTYGFSNVKTINVGATSLLMFLNTLCFLLLEGLVVWCVSMLMSANNLLWILCIAVVIIAAGYHIALRKEYAKRMQAASQKSEVHFSS